MVDRKSVIAQLKRLGVPVGSWGAQEINELPRILAPNEQITGLVNGWYENGFATLVSTTYRLLLIDKKLFTLIVEDIRYDMIAEVDLNTRLLDSTVCINTINKKLTFSSVRQKRLRDLTTYIQHRVMELRHQYSWAQYEETPVRYVPNQATNQTVQSLFVPEPVGPADFANNRSFVKPSPTSAIKPSLTTKQYTFLPRIPRRWRPSPTP